MRAFVNQRNIEANGNMDNEAYLFRGTGWMAAGIKLGAIENVVGFVPGSFGVSLLRRLLRMLGRACLIIGVMKG